MKPAILLMFRTYEDAKCAVQNRTHKADDGYSYIGFYGESMEAMNPVCENHYKKPTQWEAKTFRGISGVVGPIEGSMILDKAWPK